MLARIYGLLWLILAAVTAGLYFAGNLNELAATVLGFGVATLVFMGMSVMLPVSVSGRYATS
jgi:hypothetical protein